MIMYADGTHFDRWNCAVCSASSFPNSYRNSSNHEVCNRFVCLLFEIENQLVIFVIVIELAYLSLSQDARNFRSYLGGSVSGVVVVTVEKIQPQQLKPGVIRGHVRTASVVATG